jgi:hypothetical protein
VTLVAHARFTHAAKNSVASRIAIPPEPPTRFVVYLTAQILRTSFGDGPCIFTAIFFVVSLLSTPFVGAGIVAMAASKRIGRSALTLGFLCCALAFANCVLWSKYRGIPR